MLITFAGRYVALLAADYQDDLIIASKSPR